MKGSFLSENIMQGERIQDGRKINKAFSMCGTPQYMSPEMLAEQGHDMQSDWWSLGIILYELASGDLPF